MSILLNFIFFTFLFLFFLVCVMGWFFYHSFRSIKDRLTGGNSGAAHSDYHSRAGSNRSSDEVIIDRRSPDEAKRKIFTDGEGEYVDFEEE